MCFFHGSFTFLMSFHFHFRLQDLVQDFQKWPLRVEKQVGADNNTGASLSGNGFGSVKLHAHF